MQVFLRVVFRSLHFCASGDVSTICFSKLDVLGSCLPNACLQSSDACLGFKTFSLQEEVLDFEFPPTCGSVYQEWHLWWECISVTLPAFLQFSSFCFIYSLHSANLWFSLREYCSIYSGRLNISMRGGEFRIFLHCHLELVMCFLYFIFK